MSGERVPILQEETPLEIASHAMFHHLNQNFVGTTKFEPGLVKVQPEGPNDVCKETGYRHKVRERERASVLAGNRMQTDSLRSRSMLNRLRCTTEMRSRAVLTVRIGTTNVIEIHAKDAYTVPT
eukprot:2783043-Amphidinium_carterae.1